MWYIISQILSGIALVLICGGYFLKNKLTFTLFHAISNFLISASYLVLGEFVGGIIIFISTLRSLTFFIFDKYNLKHMPFTVPIFLTGYVLATVFLWESWLDLFPLINGFLATFSLMVKDLQHTRFFIAPALILLTVYAFFCKNYVSAATFIIELIVITVAIFKTYFERKKQKIHSSDSEIVKDSSVKPSTQGENND